MSNVQLVDRIHIIRCIELSVRTGIGDIPLELAGHDTNDRSAFRILIGILDLRPQAVAEYSKEYKDQSRNDRPDNFNFIVAVIIGCFTAGFMAIFPEEIDQGYLDKYEGDHRYPEDNVEHPIDLRRVGTGFVRQPVASRIGRFNSLGEKCLR